MLRALRASLASQEPAAGDRIWATGRCGTWLLVGRHSAARCCLVSALCPGLRGSVPSRPHAVPSCWCGQCVPRTTRGGPWAGFGLSLPAAPALGECPWVGSGLLWSCLELNPENQPALFLFGPARGSKPRTTPFQGLVLCCFCSLKNQVSVSPIRQAVLDSWGTPGRGNWRFCLGHAARVGP